MLIYIKIVCDPALFPKKNKLTRKKKRKKRKIKLPSPNGMPLYCLFFSKEKKRKAD